MVYTRLTTMKKKYLLPTSNISKSNNNNNDNTDVSNIVTNVEIVVPETQTQIVDCSQDSSTTALLTTIMDATQDDEAPDELEKLQKKT